MVFIPSSVRKHLGCFHPHVVSNGAVNIREQTPVGVLAVSSSGSGLEVGSVDRMHMYVLRPAALTHFWILDAL